MGDYLCNVVAAEMPASFELEALKAQAVGGPHLCHAKLARPSRPIRTPMCIDHTCCQAYIEPEQAASNWGANADVYTAKIRAAVAGTDGVVAQYNGQLIDAVFFSSAAGKTVDAVEVWGNSVPYLTSVESPEGEEVPNYHSAVKVRAADFKTKFLAAHPEAVLEGDPSSWFGAPQLTRPAGWTPSPSAGSPSRGLRCAPSLPCAPPALPSPQRRIPSSSR